MNDIWPSEELEKTMLNDVRNVESVAMMPSTVLDVCCHVKALLARVRELDAAKTLLAKEIRHQRRGWLNAIEVGLISGEYEKDARHLITCATVSLAEAKEKCLFYEREE